MLSVRLSVCQYYKDEVRVVIQCCVTSKVVTHVKMSKTFIGGAVCREFESEAPAAEEMLD